MGVVRWFTGARRRQGELVIAPLPARPTTASKPKVEPRPLERPDADPSAPGSVELTASGATYGAVRASLVRKAWAVMGDTPWRWLEGPVVTSGEVIASGADFDPVPISWDGSATVGPVSTDAMAAVYIDGALAADIETVRHQAVEHLHAVSGWDDRERARHRRIAAALRRASPTSEAAP